VLRIVKAALSASDRSQSHSYIASLYWHDVLWLMQAATSHVRLYAAEEALWSTAAIKLVVEVQIAVPPAVALAAVKQLCSSSSSSNSGTASFFAALNGVQCDAVSGPAGEVRRVTCAC
jgi:hypothetical protein